MATYKIFLVYLAILAIKARESQSHILQDPTKDCGCFPIDKDGIRISKLVDKFGKYDRIVIYLFKRPDSEEVMAYVPNEEKQKLFPDLTVNSLETFGLPKFEHLYQVFEPKDQTNVAPTLSTTVKPTPVDIDVHSDKVEIPTISIDHGNIDLDIPQHQHVTDSKSISKPIITEKKPESIDHLNIHGHPVTNDRQKLTSYIDPITGDKISALEIHNQATNSVDQSGQPIIIIDDIYLVSEHDHEVKDHPQPAEHVVHNTDVTSINDKQIPDHLNHIDNFINQAIGVVGSEDNHHVPDVSNVNHLDQTKGNVHVILGHDNTPNHLNENKKNLGQDTNTFPVVESESKKILDGSSGKHTVPQSGVTTEPSDGTYDIFENTMLAQGTGTNFINSLTEMLGGNTNNNKGLLPSEKLQPANSPSFDKWLLQEIQNIGTAVKGISSLHILDLQRIKIHLLVILEQNGISLSENGDLIDINGHIVKISNLKLKRVLISDPSVYKKVMGGRECLMPYDIPYLEAVFVNLVYPPKVLGLIPLRLTYLPRCKGSSCRGKLCTKTKISKPVIMNKPLTKKLNLIPVHNHQLKSTNLLLNKKQGQTPQGGLIVKMGDNIQVPSHVVEVSDDHVDDTGDKTPSSDNDDGLGIRIIGGHAATSSGTPVSSRGRAKYYKGGYV